MALISFSKFLNEIECGAKTQIIRPPKIVPIEQGDHLYLYWMPHSPKDKKKIGESTCIKITPVVINEDYIEVGGEILDYHPQTECFAQSHGFKSWDEMRESCRPSFWQPLVIIEWEYPFLKGSQLI